METIRRDCHCGHHLDSHYKDTEGSGCCLCSGCDCPHYRNWLEPDTLVKKNEVRRR